MRLFLFFLSLGISLMASAQCRLSGKITGPNDEPIIAAVITLTDSGNPSVTEYCVTNIEGLYSMPVNRSGKYTMNVSCLGYVAQEKEIVISNVETAQNHPFQLNEDAILLNEVMITSKRTGVYFRGDTIKYDTNWFKDGSERVLGDVLNKLPGIEVDDTGKVKSQGKPVDKVLFNGNDFFNGNSQVAVKNLSADIAENVEVINNYSEYSLLDGFQSHEGTAINIGVNKGFLGKLSGEISAAYGIEDKQQVRGNVMKLGKKSMLAFIGSYNNTGAEVFSIDDYVHLQGGAKALVNNQKSNFIQLSEEEKELLTPTNNVYSRDNGLASLNFSNQFTSKWKLSGYLLYNTKKERSREESRNTYFIPGNDDLLFYNQGYNRQRTNFMGSNINMKYDVSENLKLDYKGVLTGNGLFRDSENTDSRNNVELWTFDKKNNRSFKMNHVLSFIKGTSAGLLTGDVSGKYSHAQSGYILNTDSLLLPFPFTSEKDLYAGNQKQHRTDYEIGATIGYSHKLGGLILEGLLASSYKDQSWGNDLFSGSESFQEWQNETQVKWWDHHFYAALSRKKGLFRFNLGGAVHLYNLSTGPLPKENKRLWRFTPDVDMTLYFSSKNIVKAYFNTVYQPIAPENYSNQMNIFNYKSLYVGSDLRTHWTSRYNCGLSYQFYDLFSNTMFFLTGGYTITRNEVTYDYHTTGILSERTAVNSPDSYTVFGNFYLEKGFSAPLKMNITGTYNLTGLANFLESQENKMKINTASGRISLASRSKGVVNAEVFTEITYAENRSSLSGKLASQFTQHYGGELKFNFAGKWTANLGLSQMRTKIEDYSQKVFLFNGSVQYALSRTWELSVRGQNMLHLHKMMWNTVSFDGYQQKEQLFSQIPGNILFNVSYTF